MVNIEILVKQIKEFCNPVSIFLYGSRARTDYLTDSDYEIGVLIPKSRYIGVLRIREKIQTVNDVHIFPFEFEDFLLGKIDTPFQKSIYIRELALSATTIYGDQIVENLSPPPLKLIDIIQDLRFNLGYAMASLISYRQGDIQTAIFEFYKSNLFGTRCLEVFRLRQFPLGYDQVYQWSTKLELGEYLELVTSAYMKRKGDTQLNDRYLYKNISYLNEYIETKLLDYYSTHGNCILIE